MEPFEKAVQELIARVVRREPPIFTLYVYEHRPGRGNRDAARFEYTPARRPSEYALSPRTVARLIRANLLGGRHPL